MICKQCGSILREGAVVCDQCGAEIVTPRAGTGTAARRQGRDRQPETTYVGSAAPEQTPVFRDVPVSKTPHRRRSEGAGRPSSRRGMPPAPTTGKKMARRTREKAHTVHRMMINWTLVCTVVAVLAVLALAGGFLFLKYTDQGQLMMARMGREANALAMWNYGQELLDQGYVDRSIRTFEQAYEMEPEREDIYERLQQLADAYEAGDRMADAERTYMTLIDLEPENPTAYLAVIRLMQNQNRQLELSSFLQTAYLNTGDVSFRRQREDMLPSTPTATIDAGTLLRERDVELLSAEDYEIYYVLDGEEELPENGVLYTEPIHLYEGTHILRAVAVSNDLISDELSIKYTITLPKPSAPVTTLQPGEYESRRKVGLRYVESDDEKLSKDEKQKQITIYYTIDGQTPNSNSPIYHEGEPFLLPLGRCTVKAVAVNGYGKVSNVMERTFKVTKGRFESYFNNEDEFSEFTILKTTRDDFVKKFGEPLKEEEISESFMKGICVKLTYGWGEARFTMMTNGYTLYSVDTTLASVTGPRKTKIGMGEKDVTAKFRDMEQTYDQNGDRSIYWDKAAGVSGKLYHLDDTHDRIDYVYTREDNGVVTLCYYLENGKVNRMTIQCTY